MLLRAGREELRFSLRVCLTNVFLHGSNTFDIGVEL